ncbi:MAG: ABC transporter substrate-binding protein [Acidimicrobiia bacterium]
MASVRRSRTRSVALTVAVALGLVAAACGDDASEDSSGAAATAATTAAGASAAATTVAGTTVPKDVNPDGILKVGTSLELTGGLALDPTKSVTISDEPWILNIYGSLMRSNPKGGYDPWFAKSVDIVDSKTVKVTLNTGITFSDGTPYDGAAVKTGIMRNYNTPQATAKAGQNSLFRELSDIVVDGPTQVTFQLKTAVAGEFLAVLAGREAAVPSPKAIADGVDLNTKPVGAGPYTLTDFKTGQIMSLRRNPNFFQKDKWLLGGFDFVHVANAASGVNGLLAGDVDFSAVDIPNAARVESSGNYTLNQSYTDFSYIVMIFCSTKPPFDNLKARQAVQYALDRNIMNTNYLLGKGKVAYGYWTEDHPNFNPAIKPFATPDVAKAKQLLAESGVNPAIDLAFVPGTGQQPLAEIVQNQLNNVGFKVTLQGSNDIVGTFITPQKPGVMMVPGSRTGVDKVNKIFQTGSQQNLCGSVRPEIESLAQQVAAFSPSDPKVAEIYKQIDLLVAQNAYALFLVNTPRLFAFNKSKVGGTPVDVPTKSTVPYQNFEGIYIKK